MIALAIAIGAVALVGLGGIPEGMFLALLLFILLGAIFPPVAIPLGVVILVALLYKGDIAAKVTAWLSAIGTAPAGPPVKAAPIAPSLPNNAPVAGQPQT